MPVATALFDFDGTIADTYQHFVKIFNRIAPEYGGRVLEPEDLERLRNAQIHPRLFAEFGISWLQLPRLLLRFRHELKQQIAFVQPIAGMIEAIVACKQHDLRLGIMTSNDRSLVAEFLHMHDLDQYFDFIYSGKNLFGKAKVLKRLMAEQGVVATSAVYIGDETRDVDAAKQAGLRVIAVGWGFSSKLALQQANPTALVEQPAQLSSALQAL